MARSIICFDFSSTSGAVFWAFAAVTPATKQSSRMRTLRIPMSVELRLWPAVRGHHCFAVIDVHAEPRRSLPHAGDRQFHFLVDIPFQEARAVSCVVTLLRQLIDCRFGHIHLLTLAFHLPAQFFEIQL